MSLHEPGKPLPLDIDEANRHAYIQVRELSGLFIGHGVWQRDRWEYIVAIRHEPDHTWMDTFFKSIEGGTSETGHRFELAEMVDVTKYRSGS